MYIYDSKQNLISSLPELITIEIEFSTPNAVQRKTRHKYFSTIVVRDIFTKEFFLIPHTRRHVYNEKDELCPVHRSVRSENASLVVNNTNAGIL